MPAPMKALYWFVVANAYLAAFSLIFFPYETDKTFFWRIAPPLSAGMFGVLYLAAGTLVLQAVLRGRWETARYLTAMVPVFTGMVLLTTFLHTDRFVRDARFYYWLAVYIVAPLAGLLFYYLLERDGRANWQVVQRPVRAGARRVLVGLGVLMAVLVIAGYIFPQAVIAFWPWELTPLMVRIFLSWVSAMAVSLLWFAVDREWTRVQPVAAMMVTAAGLMLLVLFIHPLDIRSAPGTAVFGLVLAATIIYGVMLILVHQKAA
ncbi:MAG: hypothetical protein EHM70_04740 [Chloroflexota bacterium]|nr:MAG: hypothetical protein EHM70_04740 [Chloroflexota bacterium]